jgi:hypothetical protein
LIPAVFLPGNMVGSHYQLVEDGTKENLFAIAE